MRELTRFPAEVKAELLTLVTRTQARTGWTGWTVQRVLHHLGLTKARYRDWMKRAAAEQLADRRPGAPACDAILPEEKAAVLTYALAHPKDGYRRLTWQMVDADVAYLSESSVHRILHDANLLARWKRHRSAGTAPRKPEQTHERWHTDLMYLRIADSWYFLVTVLDKGRRRPTVFSDRPRHRRAARSRATTLAPPASRSSRPRSPSPCPTTGA